MAVVVQVRLWWRGWIELVRLEKQQRLTRAVALATAELFERVAAFNRYH